MKRTLTCLMLLIFATMFVAVAEGAKGPPRLAAVAERTVAPQILESIAEAKGLEISDLDVKACVMNTMGCNTTRNGVLTTDDCALDDGTFIDFWEFQGSAGTTVTISMTSSDFDTFLWLLDPAPAVVASDDDSGSGTNSRIVHTMNSSGLWTIGANSFWAAEVGDYTLRMDCDDGTPDPEPPAAPSNLTATTISTSEIALEWRDNSSDEEEFRVELREQGGSFHDLGTFPANRVQTVAQGLKPATRYDFRVRARNAVGFSAYSNVATAATLEPGDLSCVPSETAMCLNKGRFKVEVEWRDFLDQIGQARVVPVDSDDSGIFYFFSPNNWEMLVKVLDACSLEFNSFWVFCAATTDVEYTMRVTDTASGEVKLYFNRLGTAAPAVTDTRAFETCP